MNLTISIKERLEIYQVVLETFKRYKPNNHFYLCPLIQDTMCKLKGIQRIDLDSVFYVDIITPDRFPEFISFKPEDKPFGFSWFGNSSNPRSYEMRLHVMESCVRMCKESMK